MNVQCPLCEEKYEAAVMQSINDEETLACPRCVFLIALYMTRGVKKRLTAGCLKPHFLNNEFQKILRNEFIPHPAETYQKYLGEMIAKEEVALHILRLPDDKISKIMNDWPFVLLAPQVVKKYNLLPGSSITLRGENDAKLEIKRRIWSMAKLNKKQAAKYDDATSTIVCFIPPPEYDN